MSFYANKLISINIALNYELKSKNYHDKLNKNHVCGIPI